MLRLPAQLQFEIHERLATDAGSPLVGADLGERVRVAEVHRRGGVAPGVVGSRRSRIHCEPEAGVRSSPNTEDAKRFLEPTSEQETPLMEVLTTTKDFSPGGG